MLQFIGILLSVVVPAAFAYGSSARRRLTLIHEEIKIYKELPDNTAAKKVFEGQITQSADAYQTYRQATSRLRKRYLMLALFMLSVSSAYWGTLVLTGVSPSKQIWPDEEVRTRWGAYFFGAGIVATMIVTAYVMALRAHVEQRLAHSRTRRSPKGNPPQTPPKDAGRRMSRQAKSAVARADDRR